MKMETVEVRMKIDQSIFTAEPGILDVIFPREFDAPQQLVPGAFTDPDLYQKW
jgi:hypothetical protein